MSDRYGIGARIQCFYDDACVDELEKVSTAYVYRLGPVTGFNGTDGDYISQRIFLKNTGDTNATDTYVIETGDTQSDFFRMKTGNQPMTSSKLYLGTLEPNAVVELLIYSIIPKKSDAVDAGIIDYTIKFNTRLTQVNDIDYYVDSKGNDNVEYSETTEYVPTYEGGKAKSFQEFKITNLNESGDEVPMRVPVRIKYHKEKTLGLDNPTARNGRAYGYGPYGPGIYGQAGMIHITDEITCEIPILGERVQSIAASYSILAKYNGKETTIEDIQSYYTEKFMMLGCYDGPALPLWLNEGE